MRALQDLIHGNDIFQILQGTCSVPSTGRFEIFENAAARTGEYLFPDIGSRWPVFT
jgi:hypothetical protein